MHRVELDISDKKSGEVLYRGKHSAPSGWHELTRKHLLLWASVMSSAVEIKTAKSLLASLMYGIPKKLVKYIPKSRYMLLANSLNFLFKRNDLENWLIPSFWFRLRRYHGPKKRLSNMTTLEFNLCEFCYEQFDNTGEMQYIETLCAILYRTHRWFNIKDDVRSDLTVNGYEARSKRFKKLNPALKWAIYLNYEGCRNFIIRNNKDVFQKSSAQPEKVKKRAVKITPWSKILENMAGGAFGPYEQTERANIHKFLSKLGQQIRDHKEAEERLKKK